MRRVKLIELSGIQLPESKLRDTFFLIGRGGSVTAAIIVVIQALDGIVLERGILETALGGSGVIDTGRERFEVCRGGFTSGTARVGRCFTVFGGGRKVDREGREDERRGKGGVGVEGGGFVMKGAGLVVGRDWVCGGSRFSGRGGVGAGCEVRGRREGEGED